MAVSSDLKKKNKTRVHYKVYSAFYHFLKLHSHVCIMLHLRRTFPDNYHEDTGCVRRPE